MTTDLRAAAPVHHVNGWATFDHTMRVGRREVAVSFFAPDRAAAEAYAARQRNDAETSTGRRADTLSLTRRS